MPEILEQIGSATVSNRLSHSSLTKFSGCGREYKLHYVDGFRPELQSAALLFGSAMDQILGTYLLAMKNRTALPDLHALFEKAWRTQNIHNAATYLPTAINVVYANSDYDKDLFEPEDLALLTAQGAGPIPLDYLDGLKEEKKSIGYARLPDDMKKIWNLANWICLYHKGHLMIDAVLTQIIPNIQEVLSVQEETNLRNATGDEIIGFLDAVVIYKDIAKALVIDWKTSSLEYDQDAVILSQQMTLYVHSVSEKYGGTRLGAFFVLRKGILKEKTKGCSVCGKDGTGQRHKTCDAEIDGRRCDGAWTVKIKKTAEIQIIIDEINKHTEALVLENAGQVNLMIKNNTFHANLNFCERPWGKCDFFNICRRGTMDGIIKVEKTERKR